MSVIYEILCTFILTNGILFIKVLECFSVKLVNFLKLFDFPSNRRLIFAHKHVTPLLEPRRSRYNLTSSSGGGTAQAPNSSPCGSLRVRARYCDELIMPSSEYNLLLEVGCLREFCRSDLFVR